MKRNRKRDFNNRKRHINPAIPVFAVTLFVTLTVGIIFLAITAGFGGNGNDDSLMTAQSGESSFVTRLPNGEKIEKDVQQQGTDDNSSETETGESTSTDTGENAEASEVDQQTEESQTASEEIWNKSIKASDSEVVTLAFAGDILFDPGYAIMNSIRQHGGISGVFGGSLLSYMRGADIMVVNNEFPYSNRGTPLEDKTFTFRADPSSADLLNDMGVDVATIANNHIYDYGSAALLDTLTALDNAGIARTGAGANIDEASHPVYYTVDNGVKIAIIAATEIERFDNPDTKGATETSAGVFRCLDISRLQSRIREAKNEGAFVIVCIHWGTENQEEIDWWQQKQGPEIADAGADLIIGSHPHILQKIDYIGNVPVVYSLGNYLFNSKDLDTTLVRAFVHTDGSVNLQFIPAVQSGSTVAEATGDRRNAILGHIREISPGISIDDEGYISKR